MPSITRAQRYALAFLSGSAYIAWLVGGGTRTDERPWPDDRAIPFVTPPPDRPLSVAALIVRDPFARPTIRADAPLSIAGRSPGDLDSAAVPDVPDVTLLSRAARRDPGTLILRATLVGRTSVAFVGEGDRSDVVRVGDRIGGTTVSAIDLRGVDLADGRRLVLREATAPDADRAPLVHDAETRARASAIPRASATATTTPSPTSSATPIVDPSDPAGREADQNPAPDRNAPTAYPVPYPYAGPARR